MKTKKKRDGSVEIVRNCVLCGSKDNLELNITRDLFHCWSCHYSGRVSRFFPELTQVVNIQAHEDAYPKRLERFVDLLDRNVYSEGYSPNALSYVNRRGFTEANLREFGVIEGLGRLWFPCGTGCHVGRMIVNRDIELGPYNQAKTVTSGTKSGFIGDARATHGKHIVLVEGDFKAMSIPLPWYGLGIGGKFFTEEQVIKLKLLVPKSVTLMLDGGEEHAVAMARLALAPLSLRIATGLPPGKGPDDIPRGELLGILARAAGTEFPFAPRDDP